MPKDEEFKLRKKMVLRALNTLTVDIQKQTVF